MTSSVAIMFLLPLKAFFTKQLLVTIFLKALFNTIAFAINTCHSIGDILKHEGKNQSITTLKIH